MVNTQNKLIIVAAMDTNGLIGLDDKLPWSVPSEMKHFKSIVDKDESSVLLIGKETLLGLPLSFLKEREKRIVVMTRTLGSEHFVYEGMVFKVCSDLFGFMDDFKEATDFYLLGGARLYEQYIASCDVLYLSEIFINVHTHGKKKAHYFPEIPSCFKLVKNQKFYPNDKEPPWEFKVFKRY